MTKHGGVIRDIIFMALGGWPFAGTTIMGICDPRMLWSEVPEGAFHPAYVLSESIRGTHNYTNPMGIPMAWSEYLKHPRNVKGFALGHSIGIMPEAKAQKGTAKPGDYVVLIGGPTGLDGIHGATVSSSSATAETSTVDAAHVQIGAPIEERKFMEAIPILRDANCTRAKTDCGAAGLGSACGEMGDDCGGIWYNTAWVPLKCADLLPWQIEMSESQERGVLAVPPAKLPLTLAVLREHEVSADVIGIFTDSGSYQVVHDETLDPQAWLNDPQPVMTGLIVNDLPYALLNDCPLPTIEVRPRIRAMTAFEPPVPRNPQDWVKLVSDHLSHFNIADQSVIAHRYDQTVQGNTVTPYIGGIHENMQDDLAVFAPLRGQPYGCGIANAVNQFYGEVDPKAMGQLVYVEAITRLVAAGFSPADITTCANVYTPTVTDSPENAHDLVELVTGYTQASEELGIPVITGKDSSSGTFWTKDRKQRIDAPLTLDVLAVGRCPDTDQLVLKPFRKSGDKIYLFHPGIKERSLGGSVFLDSFGQRGDKLHSLDLSAVREGWERYHAAVDHREFVSRSAIGPGGLIRRLFEAAVGSGFGCAVEIPYQEDPILWLFGEASGSIMFTTQSDDWWEHDLEGEYTVLGQVKASADIAVLWRGQTLFTASLEELCAGWQKTVKEVLS